MSDNEQEKCNEVRLLAEEGASGGTFRIGQYECSLDILLDILGPSLGPSGDGKSTEAWHFMTPYGIATLYDYKGFCCSIGGEGDFRAARALVEYLASLRSDLDTETKAKPEENKNSVIKITKDQACELLDARKGEGHILGAEGLTHEDDICTEVDGKFEYHLFIIKDAQGKIWGAEYSLEKGNEWMRPWEYDEGDFVEFKPAYIKTVTTYSL